MRRLFIILFSIVMHLTSTAQSSRDFFTFHGVARDAGGKIIANKTIALRLSINPILNLPVFTEEHKTATDAHGIFTVLVGGGNLVAGNFENIHWASGAYILNVDMDVEGGSNFTSMGSSQLVSVPYAIHSKQADHWKQNGLIVQTGVFDEGQNIPDQLPGTRLIWHPKKAAFRAGYINSQAWNNNNIGQHTAAFGFDTKAFGTSSFAVGNITEALGTGSLASGDRSVASGSFSTAMGSETKAQSNFATSMGRETIAKGVASTALGIQSTAHGVGSTATGYVTNAEGNMSLSAGEGTFAKAYASTTIGSFNNVQDNPSGPTHADAKPADRIFQIGNGTGPTGLSNAVTVLRNGNVGLGNNALTPQYILDISGRSRIRHSAESAGLYFDNSNHEPKAFVGMKTDNEIGFYLGNAWRFWVRGTGGAELIGGLDQVSDKRLKRDFSPLSQSFEKVAQLRGYHYYWKDKALEQSLQTGFIAQEVETLFPELVTTNAAGMKAVNYVGLIPHLVESIKALRKENEQLKSVAARVDHLEESLKALMQSAGKNAAGASVTK